MQSRITMNSACGDVDTTVDVFTACEFYWNGSSSPTFEYLDVNADQPGIDIYEDFFISRQLPFIATWTGTLSNAYQHSESFEASFFAVESGQEHEVPCDPSEPMIINPAYQWRTAPLVIPYDSSGLGPIVFPEDAYTLPNGNPCSLTITPYTPSFYWVPTNFGASQNNIAITLSDDPPSIDISPFSTLNNDYGVIHITLHSEVQYTGTITRSLYQDQIEVQIRYVGLYDDQDWLHLSVQPQVTDIVIPQSQTNPYGVTVDSGDLAFEYDYKIPTNGKIYSSNGENIDEYAIYEGVTENAENWLQTHYNGDIGSDRFYWPSDPTTSLGKSVTFEVDGWSQALAGTSTETNLLFQSTFGKVEKTELTYNIEYAPCSNEVALLTLGEIDSELYSPWQVFEKTIDYKIAASKLETNIDPAPVFNICESSTHVTVIGDTKVTDS